MSLTSAWLAYGIAWAAFGALHSLLADHRVKSLLGSTFGAGYRLAYNLFATATFIGIIAIGLWAFSGMERFAVTGGQRLVLSALSVCGWFIVLLALREYDLGRFSGLAQIRASRDGDNLDEDGPLHTSGLHRFVRHPLYTGLFLALWGGAWTPFGLSTAIFASAYLLIGTWFEERRLVRAYGDEYRRYKRRVPAFVPWKGRA